MCVASLTLIFTRSVGTLQPMRLLSWVGSKFNWPSEDQCQRSHSIWVFVFIPHLKSKYSQLIVSKLFRKTSICPRWSPWRLIVLVRSLSPRDWTLCDCSSVWPTLTWLAKLVGVSVSSSVQNTNFRHTLKPWNSWASVVSSDHKPYQNLSWTRSVTPYVTVGIYWILDQAVLRQSYLFTGTYWTSQMKLLDWSGPQDSFVSLVGLPILIRWYL